MREQAILIDASDCTGCNSCTYKCIQEFGAHEPAALGLFRTVALINDEGVFHRQCMHCKEPQCVIASAGAMERSEYGAVLLDAAKLTNPKEVEESCPFGVLQQDERYNGLIKCNMCAHRVSEGRPVACSEACPVSAIQCGDYETIVAMAKQKAARGKLTIYGLKENGGTHVLMLMKGKPAESGYPQVPASRAKARRSAQAPAARRGKSAKRKTTGKGR